MNPEAIAKLLKNLRSGQYRQIRRYMGWINQHGLECNCILGVACRVYQAEVGGLLIYIDKYGIKHWDDEYVAMPEKVARWYGFRNRVGGSDSGSLSYMNDLGKSFWEAADYIESEPRGLFIG